MKKRKMLSPRDTCFIIRLLSICVLCHLSEPKETLHLISIGSLGLEENINFVIDIINNRSDILPHYQLQLHHSMVPRQDIGAVMKAFFDEIRAPPVKLLLLGPSYSQEAAVVADTAKHFNLMEIGYTITSPLLANSEKYPLFARTIEDTALNNPAIIKVMKEFNWKKTAKIVLDYDYITPTAVQLQTLLDRSNISVLASTTYSSDPTAQIKHIKESGAKIILTFSSPVENNPRVFCRAYREGLYGARYQWLFWSGQQGHGLNQQIDDTTDYDDDCTRDMIQEAMEGTISFMPITRYSQDRQIMTDFGHSMVELTEIYQEYLRNIGNTEARPSLMEAATDAVWAAGMALNNSIERLAAINRTLEDFNYNDRDISSIIYDETTKLKFQGLSGSVAFDKNGNRLNTVGIVQVQGGKLILVGGYDPLTHVLTWSNDTKVKFQGKASILAKSPGGDPPSDSTVIVSVVIVRSWNFYYVLCACAAVGIIYSALCMAFNFKYRHTKLVKLSSPRINTIIAAGCCLAYISIILMGLEAPTFHSDWLCMVRIWMLVYSFTFAFGSMFSKTWRVHMLFTNKKLQRKVVKDLHLLGLVLALVGIDTLILILWQAVDPLHWKVELLQERYDDNDNDMLYQPEVHFCTSQHNLIWSGVFYIFKAVLLIFGIFFAWETRKIQIEALNDSKQIGVCVYNVMIMSVVAVPLINLLSIQQVDISYGVASIAILICATTTLVLVFGSKMCQVYKHGNKVDEMTVFPTWNRNTTSVPTGRDANSLSVNPS